MAWLSFLEERRSLESMRSCRLLGGGADDRRSFSPPIRSYWSQPAVPSENSHGELPPVEGLGQVGGAQTGRQQVRRADDPRSSGRPRAVAVQRPSRASPALFPEAFALLAGLL